MSINLKNTTVGMLLVLRGLTNIDKMYTSIQSPALDELFDYLNKIPDEIIYAAIPSYDLISSRNFLYTNLMLSPSKQLSVHHNHVDDIYTETFYPFVLEGYKYLHATPVFTIANLDVFTAVAQMGGKLKLTCQKLFSFNDVYYKLEAGDTSCILFSSHYNIRSLYRTTHKVIPLNQLYILTRELISTDNSKLSQLVDAVCLVMNNDLLSVLCITHDTLPYHLFRMEFVASQVEVANLATKITPKRIEKDIADMRYKNVIFGQSLSKTLDVDDLDSFVKMRYIPDCFVWRRIQSATGTMGKDKLLMILTLMGGTIVVYYKLTIHNFKCPREITSSFLPNAVLFNISLSQASLIRRVSQAIYYIPSISCVFVTNHSIFNNCPTFDATYIKDTIKSDDRNQIMHVISTALNDPFEEYVTLFADRGVTLTKIKFKSFHIITFCSLASANLDVTRFLNKYISSLTLPGIKNGSMIENLFTLFNVTA